MRPRSRDGPLNGEVCARAVATDRSTACCMERAAGVHFHVLLGELLAFAGLKETNRCRGCTRRTSSTLLDTLRLQRGGILEGAHAVALLPVEVAQQLLVVLVLLLIHLGQLVLHLDDLLLVVREALFHLHRGLPGELHLLLDLPHGDLDLRRLLHRLLEAVAARGRRRLAGGAAALGLRRATAAAAARLCSIRPIVRKICKSAPTRLPSGSVATRRGASLFTRICRARGPSICRPAFGVVFAALSSAPAALQEGDHRRGVSACDTLRRRLVAELPLLDIALLG